MICDECGKNTAEFSVTITSGGESCVRRLCAECKHKMESTFTLGNVQGFLSSVLGMLASGQKHSEQDAVCDVCGLRYSEFERGGRLGCAHCYQAFQKELKPMLQRIHGSSQHVGRTPGEPVTPAPREAEPTPAQLLQQQIDELRQKMDDAVAVENFEAAAQYRDRIRALTEEAGEPTCN